MNRGVALSFVVACLLVARAAHGQTSAWGLRQDAPQASPVTVAKALAQICPSNAIIRNAASEPAGCQVCPPGTTSERLGMPGQQEGRWVVSGKTLGRFTSADSVNLLLEGDGCEPHANNFGGTFVFSLREGSPKLLRYDAGLMTSPCRELRLRDGRNFLVCENDWQNQGWQSSFVYSLVFGVDGEARRTFLFMTHDSTGTCGDPTAVNAGDRVIQASDIRSVRFLDLNGDGLPDLVLKVALGKKRMTAAEWKECWDASSGFNGPSIPTRIYTIRYLFDGNTFHPTASGRATLKLFDRLPPSRSY